MGKYRSKEIVEAFLWTCDSFQTEDPEWIVDAIKKDFVSFENSETSECRMIIEDPDEKDENPFVVERGTWIVYNGYKIYPMEPTSFEKNFEAM